jgi:hypothetical protein
MSFVETARAILFAVLPKIGTNQCGVSEVRLKSPHDCNS